MVRTGAAILVIALTAVAQAAEPYQRQSQQTWSALQCAAIAEIAEIPEERDRLFLSGIEAGQKFLDAFMGMSVGERELPPGFPLEFLAVLRGPNADFILGRIWEVAQESAKKEILSRSPDTTLTSMNAYRAFVEKNCGLI